MKTSVFKKKWFSEGRIAKLTMEEYEQGVVSCENCGTKIAISSCTPLSLIKCPKCADVVFVPWKVANWWAMHPLAAGGFGAVYIGRSLDNLPISVAIKVLQRGSDIDEEAVVAFEHESEVAYALSPHACLAETYAIGEQDNMKFMVQQFIDGQRLNAYIDARSGLGIPPEECLYYALDIISALKSIYQDGYIYRDVKPENIILSKNGLAVLIDYGACLTIEEALNSSDKPVIGSPLYMAPERYLRMGDDDRGDIYSLGMVLFFALHGDSYFSPTEIQRIARGHTGRLRLQTHEKLKGMDEDIIELVDKMIKRNYDERFQCYEDVEQVMFVILKRLQSMETKDPLITARRRHFIATYGETG